MSVVTLARLASVAVPACWIIVAVIVNQRFIWPNHVFLLASAAIGGYIFSEVLKRKFGGLTPFKKWVPTCLFFFAVLLPAALIFFIPSEEEKIGQKVAKVKAEEEVAERKKVEVGAQNIQFSEKAGPKAFGPVVKVEIPASDQPVWAFGNILPPKIGETWVRAELQGIVATDYRAFLVEGDKVGMPLPLNDLEGQVVEGPGKITPVVRLGRLPFQGNIGSNKGMDLSVLYYQTNQTGIEQKIGSTFELPAYVEQWVVTVDREVLTVDGEGKVLGVEGTTVTLPETGWKYVWVVPMRDFQHQAQVLGKSIGPQGLDAHELPKEAIAFGFDARPEKDLPYSSLMVQVGGEKPTILEHHQVWPLSQVAGKTIRLRLNAAFDDTLAKHSKPAQVLVGGWKEPPAFHW